MGKKNKRITVTESGRGVYIHVPFCRQACRYCDFYFTVSPKYMDRFVECVALEIRERRSEVSADEPVTSIYMGGGTPSLMAAGQLDRIMEPLHQYYPVAEHAEKTIECNPDDLTTGHLKFLKERGFNRLSIGIQSFDDRDLELLRRSHDAKQAVRSITEAASAGFDNLNIDLIYGIPGQTADRWMKNLERLSVLPVSHLSAYHLTFEPGTVFDHWRKKGQLVPVHEQESERLYDHLCQAMAEGGFDHYEISNFAHGDSHSRHNLVYWTGAFYQGFGPSAHSFNGSSRSWNVASLIKYIEGIEAGTPVRETEILKPEEAFHDYLITSLRTRFGAEPELITELFGVITGTHFNRKAARLLSGGLLENRGGRIVIPPGKWLVTDHILRELFLDSI